jgi:hypothetical protein
MSKRIYIVLPERSIARLEALKDLTDASSVTEVIKHALMTYESLAEHIGEGVVFTGHKPSGESFAVEFMIDVAVKVPHLQVVSDGDRKVV